MPPSLQQAIDYHRNGKLAEAERIYAEVIAAEPGNVVAQQMMGTLKLQQGREIGRAHV